MFLTIVTSIALIPTRTGKDSLVNLAIISIIFIIELLIFIWALSLAIRCGQHSGNMLIHILLAIFFPYIYIIFALATGCSNRPTPLYVPVYR